MTNRGPPSPGPGLLRPLLLAAAGLAVLGGAGWLALRATTPPQPPAQLAAAPPAKAPAPAVVAAAPTAPAPAIAAAPPSAAPQQAVLPAAPRLATPPAPAPQAVTPPPVVASPAPPAAAPPPATAASPEKPSFDIVRVSPTGSAVVAGRAAPGAEVTLRDNGRDIGSTRADASGQFVILPADPLGPGGRELTLSARDQAGAQTTGSAPVVVAMPTPPSAALASAAPGTAAPAPSPPAVPLVMISPPNAAPRVLQGPGATRGPASRVALNVVDYDSRGEIRFAGRGPVGAVVRLYIDNQPAGEVVVDANGDWTMTPDRAVPPGEHALRLDQLSHDGKVVSREELPFQRARIAANAPPAAAPNPAGAATAAASAPAAPETVQVVVQPRESLWRIARSVYGQGVRYTVIYQANRDHIRNPDLIYPGQVFTVPAATPDSSSKSR